MTGPARPFRLDGTELAGYLVHSFIGRGGMAYVYRAEDRRLGRTVALKVLAPEVADNEDFRRRFLRESRLAASLDHPNIIPIYDAGEADGMLYIAMRYVEGSDLKAVVAGGRQLDIPRFIDIFSQVADALDAAHAHGLVHRDVKPANILISPGAGPQRHDHVYLSDFGVTKRASSMSEMTAAGVIVGTMDYLAPEQIAGKPVTARTDVYALGCVVYQCLTGSVPFVRDDDAALLWAHLVEALPPISRWRPDLPPTVQGIVAKAMAKDAEDRYASCGEFIAALTTELRARGAGGRDERPVRVDTPPDGAMPQSVEPPDERAGPRQSDGPVAPSAGDAPGGRRRRTALGVLAGALALVLAVVAIAVWTRAGPSATRYEADNLVPFSFSYPADWSRAGPAQEVVFSPHAAEFLPLLTGNGDAASWARVRRILAEDPDGAIGMFTRLSFTDYAVQPLPQQQQILQQQLPAAVTFGDPLPRAVLDGSPATRLAGQLSDPADSGTVLRFECYITLINMPQPRTVSLLFFSSAEAFDEHRAAFDRIIESVDLPG